LQSVSNAPLCLLVGLPYNQHIPIPSGLQDVIS
jgi:hypothetical protein